MIITVRPEQQADISEIFELNKLAFGQENEGRLVNVLRSSPGFVPGLSLVAVAEGALVGHILFSKVYIVSGDARHETLALAPMSVHPGYQKQGVGAIDHCRTGKRARQRIWVGGGFGSRALLPEVWISACFQMEYPGTYRSAG